jgi:hypothetical protein
VNLSSEILDWYFGSDSSSGLDFELSYRAHEIWRHAREKLNGEPSEFDKIDAVCALKRAVNHRLKTLSAAYCFDYLPYAGKKKTIEKFQYYGIIRPSLLKELLAIRNKIEHEDAPPPNIESCNRYLDFVWYFLKSTDSLLYLQVENIVFSESSGLGEITFDVKFESSWRIIARGKVDRRFLVDNNAENSLLVEEILEKPDYIKDGIYGILQPSEEQLEEIARLYFGVSGFWWDDHL